MHIETSEKDTPYLYITDYTAFKDLPAVLSEDAWARGLDGQIVKVSLVDKQVDLVKTIEPGCFYAIRNMRLKNVTMAKETQGRLGGEDRLIHRLKVKDTTNEELKALLR